MQIPHLDKAAAEISLYLSLPPQTLVLKEGQQGSQGHRE